MFLIFFTRINFNQLDFFYIFLYNNNININYYEVIINMQKKHSTNNQIWIYGKHSVINACLNPNREVSKILVVKDVYNDLYDTLNKNSIAKSYKIEIVDKKHIESLIPVDSVHQGYLALVKPIDKVFIEDIINNINNKEKSTILILDQVSDPRNIGAIMRTAVAFDVDAIVTTKDHAPKETSSMVKAATGGIEILPWVDVVNLANTIKLLKDNGFWIVGMDANTKENIDSLTFKKTAIIFGAEGKGLRELTRKSCDVLAKIPMNNKNMESLNISNAVAIALFSLYKNN